MLEASGRYEARRDAYHTERDGVERTIRHIAHARLVTFLVAATLGVLASSNPTLRTPFLAGTLVFLFLFLILILRTLHLRRQSRRATILATINIQAAARTERQWADAGAAGLQAPADHPYADDLDVVGSASLASLLGSVRSAPGQDVLVQWLLGPSPREEVLDRQHRVRALTPMIDFRQQLEAAAWDCRETSLKTLAKLMAWVERKAETSTMLVTFARLSSVVTTTLLTLHVSGVVSKAWWLIPVAINIVVTLRVWRRIHAEFQSAGVSEQALRAYAEMFSVVETVDLASDSLLQPYKRNLKSSAKALGQLRQLVALSELRLSQIYPFVQAILLWDVHVLDMMVRWKRRHGVNVRGWFGTLGELEAVGALAGLSHDHPEWVFPQIGDVGSGLIEAKGIGHPLLHPERCVANDIQVGPPGTFVLVTGSNMSGKSTLVRAVGLNVVLAFCGGPVCARQMRVSPVRMYTSMRIRDSLSDGVSYFMAELERLKICVMAARKVEGLPIMFLFDELLQGTNTAERLVAVQGVVAELLDIGAFGMLTTHDLALAEVTELQTKQTAVHFRESFDGPADNQTMVFDYVLRPGVATSRNALRLMDIMGLRRGGQ